MKVPDALVASYEQFFGEAGRAWVAALPGLAAASLRLWALTPDGPPVSGAVALVLPVRRADGTPAVLKLQPVDDETRGEPAALRAWAGRGAVRLLEHDPVTGSMLLERLDAGRTLGEVPDDLEALRILTGLMAGLHAVPPPAGLRRLGDVAADLLARVPAALARAADPALIRTCAAVVGDLVAEPGDRLLHWDLHYDNVLAARDDPDRWLAIDPKPLVGDPGFDLLAALHNRWDDVVATGDVPRAVRRRFDLMTGILGLDRERAAGWTLARILQNEVWLAESGSDLWSSAPDRAIAATLLGTAQGSRARSAGRMV